jgi:hypothetical protein
MVVPNDPLYRFIDSTPDSAEPYMNGRCDTVCITDCECTGGIIECTGAAFDFTRTVIWAR